MPSLCREENSLRCTTTGAPRGRPRKYPHQSSLLLTQTRQFSVSIFPSGPEFGTSGDFPDLSPEFVAHCFEELRIDPRFTHPLISETSILSDIRAVSFQLHLLPPQSRVLALCIVAYGSLWSFHTSVLGNGPHPESFMDHAFFASRQELLNCGVRRAPAHRALRAQAQKTAWEIRAILVPSNENAASCYLLDLMSQNDLCSSSNRPWATAYFAHVRVLAPGWWASSQAPFGFSGLPRWTGLLMMECLVSLRNGTQSMVTEQDQLLLCGREPPSLETLLESLKRSTVQVRWATVRPFLYHVISLSRQLYDKITGDFARTRPLSEVDVLSFLDSLSKMYSILSLLLTYIDKTTPVPGPTAYALTLAFSGLVLPFYRELQCRENGSTDDTPQDKRLRVLREQSHDVAALAGQEFARGIRYLPKIHHLPFQWHTVLAWAEFVVEEADARGDASLALQTARDLETYSNELKLLGYSVDIASNMQAATVIERLDKHVDRALVAWFNPVEAV
ncbi:Zn(2)-C6 fungal-type domain-containing protein [Mycena sanguinolenta]|uniref:Zn(2)-C6 fungal-type domain-containing protein n=1 Tax=Mycena sanguinolenta TaxID=230812 RepID=A0A8H6XRK6_9AGAR|nr:Zn(2)-C6 fungal-type domain-containing protein [Mycena sanguinolenta]